MSLTATWCTIRRAQSIISVAATLEYMKYPQRVGFVSPIERRGVQTNPRFEAMRVGIGQEEVLTATVNR